jgi:hypothetical protein
VDVKTALITAAVGAAIPWVTAWVTARNAPAGLKGAVTLALTATAGILTAWGADPAFDLGRGLLYAAEGWVVAVATHSGLWKPAGVTGADGAIQRAVPGGMGGRRPARRAGSLGRP